MMNRIIFIGLCLLASSMLFADTDSFSGYSINNQSIGNLASEERYYSFDGSNDYLKIPYSSSLMTRTGGFSVGMIFELDTSSDSTMFQYGEGLSDGWALKALGNGNVSFSAFNTTTLASIDSITERKIFICGTYISGRLKLYVDGVEVSDASASGDINSTDDVYIGMNGLDFYTGKVYSVFLLDSSLTQQEVRDLYSGKKSHERYILRFIPSGAGSYTWMDNGYYGLNAEVNGAYLENTKIGDKATIYVDTEATSINLSDALAPGYIITSVVVTTFENITDFDVAKEVVNGSQYVLMNEAIDSKTTAFVDISNHDLISGFAYIALTLTGNGRDGTEVWIQTEKVY